MLKIFLCLFIILGALQQTGYSQNVDRKVLKLLYDNIKKQNEYHLIKKKMKGISFVFDPVNGETEVRYSPEVGNETKESFSKFNKEEQIKILSTDTTPITLKDTLIIVDTLRFFPEGSFSFGQEQIVSIVRNYPIRTCVNCMSLYAVGIRENSLIITLINKATGKYFYNFYFDLSGSVITLQKTSAINNKRLME